MGAVGPDMLSTGETAGVTVAMLRQLVWPLLCWDSWYYRCYAETAGVTVAMLRQLVWPLLCWDSWCDSYYAAVGLVWLLLCCGGNSLAVAMLRWDSLAVAVTKRCSTPILRLQPLQLWCSQRCSKWWHFKSTQWTQWHPKTVYLLQADFNNIGSTRYTVARFASTFVILYL